MDDFSPKVRAYLEAASILQDAKCPARKYDRATARKINAELKYIASRLHKSAARIYTRERIKEMCAEDPEFARKYGIHQNVRILISSERAGKRAEKILREGIR